MDLFQFSAEFTNLRSKVMNSASCNRMEDLRTYATTAARLIDNALVNNIISEKEKECRRNELAYFIFESLVNE